QVERQAAEDVVRPAPGDEAAGVAEADAPVADVVAGGPGHLAGGRTRVVGGVRQHGTDRPLPTPVAVRGCVGRWGRRLARRLVGVGAAAREYPQGRAGGPPPMPHEWDR